MATWRGGQLWQLVDASVERVVVCGQQIGAPLLDSGLVGVDVLPFVADEYTVLGQRLWCWFELGLAIGELDLPGDGVVHGDETVLASAQERMLRSAFRRQFLELTRPAPDRITVTSSRTRSV
jgi:hypothetical protein